MTEQNYFDDTGMSMYTTYIIGLKSREPMLNSVSDNAGIAGVSSTNQL